MTEFILAIDEGTTGVTALLVETSTLKLVGKVNREFPQHFPRPGWVEHDLNQIWACTEKVIKQLLQENDVSPHHIACMGITNQRETIGAFRRDGTTIEKAITWQDRRSWSICQQLEKNAKDIKLKTGLNMDPYFSASKIKWLLENSSPIQQALKESDLLFGTIDTFLLYKLSGHTAYKTDATNASRTMLYNLDTASWDEELLALFNVQKDCIPSVEDCFGEFGKTKGLGFLPDGIPITGILGDQQAALFGQGGFQEGSIKCTYGTGSFILLNTGEKKIHSQSGMLTTLAYRHEGKQHFSLEGSCYIAGAAIQWLRDNLNIIATSAQVEELATSVDLSKMEFLTFLPFFNGIATPHWLPHAKGAIIGITRDTNKSHIARACLDGVAFSVQDIIEVCEKDFGIKLSELTVDGGMCQNNLFCQIQANTSDLTIKRPKILEMTGYGAALAAAIGLGLKDFTQINHLMTWDRTFTPNDEQKFYQKKKQQWKEMVKRLYNSIPN